MRSFFLVDIEALASNIVQALLFVGGGCVARLGIVMVSHGRPLFVLVCACFVGEERGQLCVVGW